MWQSMYRHRLLCCCREKLFNFQNFFCGALQDDDIEEGHLEVLLGDDWIGCFALRRPGHVHPARNMCSFCDAGKFVA